MVSAKNDCQSRNNKSQIGSGRASPTLSSLRIQASPRCALEVSIDFLAKGSNLVSVFGSSIDTSDLTLFPAVSL
ncbi:hypothetical protein V6N13_019775 [Hibiscus sabdariffa]